MNFSLSKNNIITGSNDKAILVDRYLPEHFNGSTVIFVHGYKGFKDWGAWQLMARQFVEKGFAFVLFNFSHNGGTVEQPLDFPDLEAFSKNTYSKELADLNTVITNTKEWLKSKGQKINISLIGHSRGGGDVILHCSVDQTIHAIITWAAISDIFSRFPVGKELQDWQQKGIRYETNTRTKQAMPVRIDIYNDAVENRERLNIGHAAEHIRIPWLIAHGDHDITVPFEEALFLKSKCTSAHLLKIEGGGHTFGTIHPYSDDVLHQPFQELVSKSIQFLESIVRYSR
jgi:pimeloyl-ACP methyl ester carboxylesterase